MATVGPNPKRNILHVLIYLESIPCTRKASKSSFGSRYESIASENFVLNEPVLESSRPKDGTYTGRTGPITFIERLNPAVDNRWDLHSLSDIRSKEYCRVTSFHLFEFNGRLMF